jgi:hypothetical protein
MFSFSGWQGVEHSEVQFGGLGCLESVVLEIFETNKTADAWIRSTYKYFELTILLFQVTLRAYVVPRYSSSNNSKNSPGPYCGVFYSQGLLSFQADKVSPTYLCNMLNLVLLIPAANLQEALPQHMKHTNG